MSKLIGAVAAIAIAATAAHAQTASPDQAVLQQLALDWAVVPVAIEGAGTIEELWARTIDVIRRSGLAAPGAHVVLTGGTLLNQPGTSDHVLVRVVE